MIGRGCGFFRFLQVAARSLFHRFDGRKSVAADRAREPFLTIEEASALDSMLMQARDSVWMAASCAREA